MPDPAPARPSSALRAGLGAAAALTHGLGVHRYLLSDPLARAAFALQPQRRRAAEDNFQIALPGLSRRQARRLAARSFREYGRSSLDFLYVHNLDRPRLVGLMRGAGVEHFQRLRAAGRGVIMVLIHLGAWDAGGAWASAMGVPLTAVMTDEGGGALQRLVVWSRAEMGIRALPPAGAGRVLLRTLRRGGWVALIADIPGDTPSLEVEFLGRRTLFSAAPTELAARTGCPLLPVVPVRGPRGTYLVDVHPPCYVARGQDPAEALRPVLEVFEAAVRRWPEQWYPFEAGRLGNSVRG